MKASTTLPDPLETVGFPVGYWCRGFNRHIALDGPVLAERHGNANYWVARFQCSCGVKRTTLYVPKTWQRVGGNQYDYSEAKDYPLDKTPEECRIAILNTKLVGVTQ